MSKVRIYELSKELNLENKNIIEICEQLDIAVKSHSSTITESQAEQIRAASSSYRIKSNTTVTQESGKKEERAKGAPTSPRPKKGANKQQIIKIHRYNRPRAMKSDEASSASSGTMLAPPPRPVAKPKPLPSQAKSPTALNPPQKSTEQSVEESVPSEVSPSSQSAIVEPASPPPKLQRPQLQSPPPRPSKEAIPSSPSSPSNSPSGVEERPILKQLKKSPAGSPRPEKPQRSEDRSQESPRPVSGKKLQKTSGESAAGLPKLQRPQKPKPPGKAKSKEDEVPSEISDIEEEKDNDIELLTDEDGLALKEKRQPKLKRPTPPRQGKRKEWEDEEEPEILENGQSNKGSNKPKRKFHIIEDDDDELDLERNTTVAVPVSLSIARPPKPKSQTSGKPPTATPKAKKASPKLEGSTSSSDTREKKRERRTTVAKMAEQIVLSESLTVRELAEKLNTPETEIIKTLFFKGIAVSITEILDIPTARLVAEELGAMVETLEEESAATKTEMLDEQDLASLQRRPPVVTIMGHVDHGKTTLLDSIRKTKVAQGEAGGITQHIGAYHVDVTHDDKQQQVVFLDTPGHEAFTAMRARGTRVTDIAILVVAADDGVQPQTREAISHAKAAGVPIVVAVNKIDKPGAEPDRVKQELTEQGLVPEEWGGDTIMVPVSAIKGENLDTLLEMILLVAEIEELSANPDRPAKGTVVEAHLDRARGPVAALLVQNGTLRVGDSIVAGSSFGKIRAMIDDRGERVEAASPSFAVEVLGLSDVPAAGDEFDVFLSEKEAREVADDRTDEQRQSRLQKTMASRRVSLSSLSAQAQEGELKELNLILKADVQGSVEAILASLGQLPQKEVQIRVLLSAPGEITETDVDLAAASGAVILGFNTTLASGARAAADQEGVDIKEYNIIYKLLDDIEGAMEGLLEPEEVEEPLGQVEVRAVFPIGRGAVAGCYVLSGKVIRNCRLRVHRGGELLYEGAADSLKRMKEDAKEVNAGFECGIGVDKFSNWKEGDIIETYQMVMKRRTLTQ